MMELIAIVSKDKELRSVLKMFIDMIENMEQMKEELANSEELEEIRCIAKKLESENSRLQRNVKSLEMDKKSLTQFIIDEVESEKLTKIFF